MESLYSFPVTRGGHFDAPQNPLVIPDTNFHDDSYTSYSDNIDDLEHKFSSMSGPEGRSFASYRSDTLSDIKFGLSKVGTVIKIASAILTLFGASDENVDRYVVNSKKEGFFFPQSNGFIC